jgi:type II secretory pathway pseudopilin PulG
MVELVIVIAIFTLLAAIGYGSIRNLIPRFRMIQVSKQFKNDIAGLRVMAIEQNREARLLLEESDPSWNDASSPQRGRWQLQIGDRALHSRNWDTLPVDAVDGVDGLTNEGTIDLSEGGNRETKGVSLMPWGAFRGPGANNLNSIVFSPKGWVTNPAGDFGTTGYIDLTLVNKIALFDGIDDSVTLHISRGGMIRVESSLGSEFEGSDAGVGETSTVGSES